MGRGAHASLIRLGAPLRERNGAYGEERTNGAKLRLPASAWALRGIFAPYAPFLFPQRLARISSRRALHAALQCLHVETSAGLH